MDNPLIDLNSEGIIPLNHNKPHCHFYIVLDSTKSNAITHCTPDSAPTQINSFAPPLSFNPGAQQPIPQPYPATADQPTYFFSPVCYQRWIPRDMSRDTFFKVSVS